MKHSLIEYEFRIGLNMAPRSTKTAKIGRLNTMAYTIRQIAQTILLVIKKYMCYNI